MVYNVHERVVPATSEQVWALLSKIGTDQDRLGLMPKWFALPEGLAPGAPVRHGPMRYRVGAVEPNRRLWFDTPDDFTGGHGFTITPTDGGALVRHEIKGRTRGLVRWLWPIWIRHAHDAVLEDLLDKLSRQIAGEAPLLPDPEFAERHAVTIAAPVERVWQALRSYGFTRGFIPLVERPPRELTVGLAGRWWRLRSPLNEPGLAGLGDFTAFTRPGYAKGTFSFTLHELSGGRTLLVTETRLVTTDPAAHRAMGRYWRIIRPGSGLIRHVMLRMLRRRALRDPAAPHVAVPGQS
jgi:uncharacterized protein YndB with AHSA1/START domain